MYKKTTYYLVKVSEGNTDDQGGAQQFQTTGETPLQTSASPFIPATPMSYFPSAH